MRRGAFLLLAIVAFGTMVNAQTNFITGCATYDTPAPGALVRTCNACAAGYILQADKLTCNIKPLGCATSNAVTGACETCSPGNYIFQGSCLSCGVGCNTCNGNSCTQCVPGYSLGPQNQCVQCTNNCATCAGNGVCSACSSGYVLGTANDGSQQCNWSPSSSSGSTGIITWLCVIFIACCLPFALLCFLLFKPSTHTEGPSMAYVPLSQGQKQVNTAPVPAPVLAPAPVVYQQQQPFNVYTNQPAQPVTTTTRVVNNTTTILPPATAYRSGY